MKPFSFVALSSAALLFSSTAIAESEKNTKFETHANKTEQACAFTFKRSVDTKKLKPIEARKFVDGECVKPIQAMKSWCALGYQDEMKAQISSYQCVLGSKDELTLEKGVLTFRTSALSTKNSWTKKKLGTILKSNKKTLSENEALESRARKKRIAFLKAEDARLDRALAKRANKKCKTTIPWSIDWKSFEGKDRILSEEATSSVYAACGVPLNRLGDLCGSDASHKVKKMVSSFTCVLGKNKLKLALEEGKLKYYVNFETLEPYRDFDNFLLKKKVIKKKPETKKMSPAEREKIQKILGGKAKKGK